MTGENPVTFTTACTSDQFELSKNNWGVEKFKNSTPTTELYNGKIATLRFFRQQQKVCNLPTI